MAGIVPSLPPEAQRYIQALEVRLELAEKALRLLPHQRGTLPGAMRAVQINDPGAAASMWMNLIGSTPGQSPYQAVTDPNGVIRAELGNLAANGNSPAQYGFRANKSDGTALFDSLGLIATVAVLGSAINFSQQSVTGNGSFQTVSGSTVSFTLSRAVNILALASGTLLDPTVGDTGVTLSCGVLVDGNFNNANGPQVFNTTLGAIPVTPFAVIAPMSAGAHSVAVGVNQTNTHLWSYIQGFLYVFSLGA